MADFLIALHPGIYRSGPRPLRSADDGAAWTQAYDALLDGNDTVVIILDAEQRPSPEAGKPLALWLKARRDVLARKVALGIYVVTDPAARAAMEATAPKAANAWPFPRAIVASFEDGETLALATTERGRPA